MSISKISEERLQMLALHRIQRSELTMEHSKEKRKLLNRSSESLAAFRKQCSDKLQQLLDRQNKEWKALH